MYIFNFLQHVSIHVWLIPKKYRSYLITVVQTVDSAIHLIVIFSAATERHKKPWDQEYWTHNG